MISWWSEFSLEFCAKIGFSGYFSRCLLTLPKHKPNAVQYLPKHEPNAAQDKIFLVNIPPQIKAKLPPELIKHAIEINQQNFANTVRESLLTRTQALLESYKNEARSRACCIAPLCAWACRWF